MHRNLSAGILILFVVAGCSSVCSAQNQKKTINKPTIPTTGPTTPTKTDLRPVLTKMRSQNKLVQGKNLVLSEGGNSAIKLYATVNNGKVTQWQAVNAGGKNLPTNTNSVAQANGGVRCFVCVRLPGHDINTCYEIDCKDAPKPTPAAATRG